MRKLILIFAVLLSTFLVKAQDIPQKEALKGEASSDVAALHLAADLVKYGYAQQSALPLVDALQIITDTPTQELDVEVVGNTGTPTTDKKNGVMTLDFQKILADAKSFANGDEGILELIAQVEEDAKGAHRGAVGGPKRGAFAVYAGCYNDFTVNFTKGNLAEVLVSGDGDTDLDLYIYDSNGNLIASDTDYTDDCYVRWVPAWTGRYTIRVVNRGGVYNNYIVLTN